MKVTSIQLGEIREIQYLNQIAESGIFKIQISGPAKLKFLGFEGDQQADLSVHGGRDKAVYAYSFDAYSAWRSERPKDQFENGALGENLTLDLLKEGELCIGDSFKLGSTIIQVSEPRFPCFKLGMKFKDPSIIKQFMKIGRPGVYFRVLQEGVVESGEALELMDREQKLVSVLELFNFNSSAVDQELLARLASVKSLSESWKRKFERFKSKTN